MAKEEQKGGNNKLLIILLVVLICGMGAVIAYLLLDSRKGGDEGGTEHASEEPAIAPEPIFIKIGPMTVNLVNDELGQHLLYTSLTLKVDNQQTHDLIDTHMPEVHSRVLLLLSSKTAEEISSPEGKEKLIGEILALFEQPLTQPQPILAISSVLFSEFIVQ